jgi:ankyrin repeat protein
MSKNTGEMGELLESVSVRIQSDDNSERKVHAENLINEGSPGVQFLLNAHALQRTALKNAYDGALRECRALVEKANLKMQEIIVPLQEKRDRLSHEAEVFALQIEYLQNCAQQEPSSAQLIEWQKSYQEDVEALMQQFLVDYKNLVAARDAIYRDGRLVSITTKEAKMQEVARFTENFRQVELLDYMNWHLPGTCMEAKEMCLLKETARKCALAQYEILMDSQTRRTEQYYAEKRKIEASTPLQALDVQLKAVFHIPEPANTIYNLCRKDFTKEEKEKTDNITALKQMLPRRGNPKTYLEQKAPRILHVACEANQLAVVRYLIEEVGFHQTQDEGYYPIHSAVMRVHSDPSTYPDTIILLDYLREQGADIDALGIYSRSPLHTAALYGCLPGATWLIAAGADINRMEKGRFQANTPLHNAAFAGHDSIVELLLLRGANGRLVNKSNFTALMEAVQQGHLAVVQVFWKHGIWLSDSDYEQLLKKPLTVKVKRCLEMPLQARLATTAGLLSEKGMGVESAAISIDAFQQMTSSTVVSQQQKGWNCFDIAAGIEREQLVQYALVNSGNLEFRRLLAPEIRHAAAITVAYMEMNQVVFEEHTASVKSQQILQEKSQRIQELFQIADVLKTERERAQIESEAIKLLNSESSEKAVITYRQGLPSSMQTGRVYQLVNDYFNAHEVMKKAVAECNDALGHRDGHRLSLEALEQWLPLNETQAEACRKLKEAKDRLFTTAEQQFKEYCESEAVYKTYVQDYYGAAQWFAFQRQFADHQSTSMVDITARMKEAKIVIHNNTNRAVIYSTNAYGARKIHVEFDGINHFNNMPEANVGLSAASTAQKMMVFSEVYSGNVGSMLPSQEDRVIIPDNQPLNRGDTDCYTVSF